MSAQCHHIAKPTKLWAHYADVWSASSGEACFAKREGALWKVPHSAALLHFGASAHPDGEITSPR